MQINRLFEIVYILLDRQMVTAKELAEYFEVSTRTIYRDIEILSGAGIPVYMNKGKGGGIGLLSDFVLDKSVLTKQQKSDILSSLQAFHSVGFPDMHETLKRMAELFGNMDTDWIEVDFGLWSDGEKEEQLFQLLKTAILQKQVVRFSYTSTKGEYLQREVEPLKLIFKGTSWYLYGFCKIRTDYRFFKLKRMQDLMQTGERFTRKIQKRVLVPQEIPEMIKVKMKAEKEAAFILFDNFMHCHVQNDGSVTAEAYFQNSDWLVNEIFSYGDKCEVLEPLWLREEMKMWLQKLLDNYKREV